MQEEAEALVRWTVGTSQREPCRARTVTEALAVNIASRVRLADYRFLAKDGAHRPCNRLAKRPGMATPRLLRDFVNVPTSKKPATDEAGRANRELTAIGGCPKIFSDAARVECGGRLNDRFDERFSRLPDPSERRTNTPPPKPRPKLRSGSNATT
jgi:hypothetical protein